MRALLLLVFCFLVVNATSQTILAQHRLKLSKPDNQHQVMQAVNEDTNEFFVFAADKKRIYVAKYNRAIFLRDTLVYNFVESDKPRLFRGYSFNERGNPTIYLGSENGTELRSIQFNIDAGEIKENTIATPCSEESLLLSFQTRNSLYFLASREDNNLELHTINEGQVSTSVIDFSAVDLADQQGKAINVKELLQEHPLELIDNRAFVPLVASRSKSKLYVKPNELILTFDHNTAQSHVIKIDLASNNVSKHIILQPQLNSGVGKSTSFYLDNILYQLKINEQNIALAATSLESGNLLQMYQTSASEEITFNNSPLSMQIGNKPPREFRNTTKFLSKAATADVALTAYQTPDYILVTCGAVRPAASTEDVMAGLFAIGIGLSDGEINNPQFDRTDFQSFYFESFFDKNFSHKTITQAPLAVDALANFISQSNEFSVYEVSPYNNYFILGYYDKEAASYILRKFEDYVRY